MKDLGPKFPVNFLKPIFRNLVYANVDFFSFFVYLLGNVPYLPANTIGESLFIISFILVIIASSAFGNVIFPLNSGLHIKPFNSM